MQLAIRLTQLGFAALRFDYRSTGDSFDRVDDRPEKHGFADDVRTAVEFVRTMGVAHIGVVGMRLGANFASIQRDCEPVEAVALWDPCMNGRSFLREQRALALFAGVHVTDEEDLPGFKLSPQMAKEISGLELEARPPGPGETWKYSDKVLLLTRPGSSAARELAKSFDFPNVERREVKGQRELLDVHDDWPMVPSEGIATVVTWFDEVMPRGSTPIVVPSLNEIAIGVPSAAEQNGAASGTGITPIRERAVWLGPAGLFGIETEQVAGGSGPVCIFVSVANEHRIGPGRLWVQLSRRLAVAGFRCVRFDINGFGDSPPRDARLVQEVFMVSAIEDVLDVARLVSPDDPSDVLLFGLCSSGYQVLEAALSLSARGVCALNPSVVFPPPEMASGGAMDARRCFCGLPRRTMTARCGTRFGPWLKRLFPTLTSKLGDRLARVLRWWPGWIGGFRDGPGKRLGDLVRGGTDVLLICGRAEIQVFSESGLGTIPAAFRKEGLQIEVIHALDHGLFPVRDRDQVTDLILAHVLHEFRPVPHTVAPTV